MRKHEYGNRAASEHDALPVSVLTRMRARGRLTVHASHAVHDGLHATRRYAGTRHANPRDNLISWGIGKITGGSGKPPEGMGQPRIGNAM